MLNAHKTKWDVIKEVAWDLLKDISGFNDIVDCFTKGDIMACGGLVLNLVPWGKVGKVLEAGYKAIRAVASMAKVIDRAQSLLRRVAKIADWAQEIAVEAMNKLRGRCNSFMPGTAVKLADGSTKPIEQVKNGDQVLAADPKSGESSSRKVVATIIGFGVKHLVKITVDGGGSVTATDQHPFWLPDQKRWAYAKDLRTGSVLQSSAGTEVQVSAVHKWTSIERVHNLTVDGFHTYYVQAGAVAVLNHNCGDKIPDTLYHYTTEEGMNGILDSGELWPSTKAARPTDAKYGDGQYFTDIEPGTKSPGQLARALHGTPWGGQRYSNYVAIDVRGLNVAKAPDRSGVFYLLGETLDVSKRIVGYGRGPIG